MAKQVGNVEDDTPRDTAAHTRTVHQGEYGDKGARVYVPGEGFYLSKHAMHDIEADCRKMSKAHGEREYDDKRYARGFISESEIESWCNEIRTVRAIVDAADKRASKREDYESLCYDGTDTQDPHKGGTFRDKRNEFDLDRSRSTIHLSMVSSTGRYLNGSAVKHQHYVHLRVESPDGRQLVDVAMTFDQFAAFLVSNMATPCTLDGYWSVTDECVRLQEVVKEPETIHARMEQRMGARLDEMYARLESITDELDSQIESGKAMSKTKLAELRKDLDVYKSHFGSNRDFTVQQAKEEVSSIVEQAAASIAWQHKLSPEELLASPHVVALMDTLVKHKALPAPKQEQT